MKRIVVVALFAAMVSCSREQTAPTKPVKIADDRPVEGGTLIRRLETDIATLNPVMATSRYDRLVDNLLFTPLIYIDQNLRPIPGLADSWEITDDGLTFTFKLNPKATFSDGQPVRASDVIFTLNKVLDPSFEAVQIASEFEEVDMTRTRAIDDHTLEVKLRKPSAPQLVNFYDLNVVPEHVYGKGDFRNDYVSAPVGSGPYRLVRRVPGKEVVVERRADYWGQKPYIQTVLFRIINEHTTAWNALRRGDIDETTIVSDTWQREHSRPELQETIDFRRFYSRSSNYIAWNNRNPLFTDRRVRRSLAMCVNLNAIINDLYHGTARAMSGPFPPDNWA
ncbi:MAG TPA: ABC transporter substrate-binding protein, partial [Thermoanaerobaculia bacterium]|nr:ABC transporter substrate-binding protein [Thermoanaerobaculia bacterium]